ncbi:MAG: hypothetical protein ACM32O_08545 [Clostridia bacterium]
MSVKRFTQAAELADTVLQLADTFGVLAAVTSKQSETQLYRWQNGHFLERSLIEEQWFTITLQTASGSIGQACTTVANSSGIVSAFHQALRSARPHAKLILSMDRLAELEKRHLPLIDPVSDYPSPVDNRLFHAIEAQHLRFFTKPAFEYGSTTVVSRNERMLALRRDGHLLRTGIQRILCQHDGRFAAGDCLNFQSGCSFTRHEDGSPSEWLAMIELGLHMQKQPKRPDPINAPSHVCQTIPQASLIGMDAQIISRLLANCIRLPDNYQPTHSKAIVTMQQVEGSPAYHPIHPSGYQLSTYPIYGPNFCDGSLLNALAAFPNLPLHLSLSIPDGAMGTDSFGSEKASDAYTSWIRNGHLDAKENLLFLEGTPRLTIIPEDDLYWVKPQTMTLYQNGRGIPLPAVWLRGRLSDSLRRITAGFGQQKLVWAQDDVTVENLQMVDVPTFTLLRLPQALETE